MIKAATMDISTDSLALALNGNIDDKISLYLKS